MAEDRFGPDLIDRYFPGHSRRWNRLAGKYAHLELGEVSEFPAMRELDRKFSAAMDRYTEELFQFYGFPEPAALYRSDRAEFSPRRAEARPRSRAAARKTSRIG